MKNKLIVLFAFLVLANIYGQKNELRVAFNSGLFSFNGKSAATISQINLYTQSNTGYTNNPFGSKNALFSGVSLNFKRASKNNFLYGVDFGYELLRSKIILESINSFDGTSTFKKEASGETFLNIKSLNLNPFLGYRFNINKFPLDLVGGFDIGYVLDANEKGEAIGTDGVKYSASINRKTISKDYRSRIQISSAYKNFGVYLGYCVGIANYKEDYVGGINEAYSKIIRFGMTYQIL